MEKNKIYGLLLSLAVVAIATPIIVKADVMGGWSEENGTVSSSFARMSARATVRHTGRAEEKTISGTGYKRAHGWTTWSKVKHYTTAQLETGGRVNGTSGRIWGTGGTEAVSPYKPYTKNGSPGSARTYYGR